MVAAGAFGEAFAGRSRRELAWLGARPGRTRTSRSRSAVEEGWTADDLGDRGARHASPR